MSKNKKCKHPREYVKAEFMGAGFIHTCTKCGKDVFPVKGGFIEIE